MFIIPGEAYHVVCEGYYTHVHLVQKAGANGVREAITKYMANLLHMVLVVNVRDQVEGVERDREREEETSTDMDSV